VKIVVVGASGNIGTALLRRLSTRPGEHSLTAVARRIPERVEPYAAARWERIDISDPAATQQLTYLFDGVDAVVHLAWQIQPSHDAAMLRRVNREGSERVVRAALGAGVPHLVALSSVGAYSPADSAARVDESWPTGGVWGASYSTDKAAVERMLDWAESEHPYLLVTRFRPALVFQRAAASEILRNFVGPIVPPAVFRGLLNGSLPALPLPRGLSFQCVHADDVAQGIERALQDRAGGAFNLAAEPVITRQRLAETLRSKPLAVHPGLFKTLVAGSWRTRLQPTAPGWIDMALAVPLVETTRARIDLGWEPARDAETTLRELLEAMAHGDGTSSPALRPRTRRSEPLPAA
jgi:nucleoside-diphosphate-sugar epimerase